MKFTVFQESRIGKRRLNQDRVAYCYSRDALLLVLADGMGGHPHGEVAAQVAVDVVTGMFQREARPHLDDPLMFLSEALCAAHDAIIADAKRQGLPEVPRTTCVACVIQENIALWAHAGDSRLYLIRDGQLVTRTRDHTMVQMMIDAGQLSEAEAACHAERNRVYSCLGGLNPPAIDFSRKTPLHDGDVIALCSDGIWSPLGKDLVHLLAAGNVINSVPRLAAEAEIRAGSGADNLSILAINWEENYSEEPVCHSQMPTMPLDVYTLPAEDSHRPHPDGMILTDNEIEQAIEEIRQSIQHSSY